MELIFLILRFCFFVWAPRSVILEHYCDGAVCVQAYMKCATNGTRRRMYRLQLECFYFLNLVVHTCYDVMVIFANPSMLWHGLLCGQQDVNNIYMIMRKHFWCGKRFNILDVKEAPCLKNKNCTNSTLFFNLRSRSNYAWPPCASHKRGLVFKIHDVEEPRYLKRAAVPTTHRIWNLRCR
jgi:hypothetical protein